MNDILKILTGSEIQARLQGLAGWKVEEGRLVKEFKFTNFPTAILFINKIVDPIEELNHHPALSVQYNRVRLSLFSHVVGGLTQRDVELAQRIDELA